MRLMLKRDLFIGGSRYKQDNFGTEVPDIIDEKEVVFWEKGKEYDYGKVIVLPRDAVLWEPGVVVQEQAVQRRLRNAGVTKPVALSQLPGVKAPNPQGVDLPSVKR